MRAWMVSALVAMTVIACGSDVQLVKDTPERWPAATEERYMEKCQPSVLPMVLEENPRMDSGMTYMMSFAFCACELRELESRYSLDEYEEELSVTQLGKAISNAYDKCYEDMMVPMPQSELEDLIREVREMTPGELDELRQELSNDAESTADREEEIRAADLVGGVREGMAAWGQENTPYVVTQVEFQDEYESLERTGNEVFVVQIDDPMLLLGETPDLSSVSVPQFFLGGPIEMLAAGIRSAPDEILNRSVHVILAIRDPRQSVIELTPTVMRSVVEGRLSGLDAAEHPSTLLTALTALTY